MVQATSSVLAEPSRPVAQERTRPGRVTAGRADAALLILFGITAVAVVLRFALIGHQGYWMDEGITVQLLHDHFFTMINALPVRETTPPLYYALAWAWARVFGFGEGPLRALSAVIGVLTVPVAYAIGARMLSRRVGLIAAALTATSPVLIWYSQEVRPYALLVLLSALSILMFDRARVQPAVRELFGWAIVSLLAIMAHYFAAMVVVPEAAWLVWVHRQRWAAWASVALVGAVGLALIPLAHKQSKLTDWISLEPLSIRLRQLRMQFLVGFTGSNFRILWFLALVVVAVAVALIIWRGDRQEQRWSVGMAALGLGGLLLALAVTLAGSDLIDTRNLLELWLPLALVLAVGLGARRVGNGGLAGVAVLCAIGIAAVVQIDSTPNLQRPDWRPVSSAMGSAPAGGARVVMVPRYDSVFPISLYHPRLVTMTNRAGAIPVSELDVITVSNSPHSYNCWWGAACELRVTRLGYPPRLAGFRLVQKVHRGRFVLMRLQARNATPETRSAIIHSLPKSAIWPPIILVEPPA